MRILMSVLGLVVAALLVCVGFLSADRWMLHDDRSSMLGEWYIPDSAASVVINDQTIKLDAATSYEYEVDETAKVITYRFGELQGQGHYWFSADRRTLVIEDGKDFTAAGTAIQDWLRIVRDLVGEALGNEAQLPSGDNLTVLTRNRPTVAAVSDEVA